MPPLPAGLVAPLGGTAPYSSALGTLYVGGFGPGSPDPDCALVNISDAGNSTNTLFGYNSWPNGAAGNPNAGDSVAAIVNNVTNVFFNQVIVDNTFQSWGCVAVDSGQLDLYAEGVLDSSHTGITTTSSAVTNGQVMYNTATANAASFTNGLNGYVPYFGMWGNRALTAADFLALKQNPNRFLVF